ncbi:MAG: hypothetical protein H6686_04845 [Fibrobacteria bacterium]|nr:hypothetical protein [Fibrobacteria bacterium]
MILRTILPVLMLVLSLHAAPTQNNLISRAGEVPVWLSPDRQPGEEPLYRAPAEELLLKQDTKGDMIQVRTRMGAVGWVEASKVREFVAETGTTVDLGQGTVQGYLDNPNAIYILTDESKIPPEGFSIMRDMTAFVLDDNIDRETLERRNEENF